MMIRRALIILVTLAGVSSAILPARGQAIHGESIGAPEAATAPPPATNQVAAKAGEILNADFETLASYNFDAPSAVITNQAGKDQVAGQIPEAIKKLDGKLVRIRGFMMPVTETAGKTTEFMITRSQPSCCFGGATGPTEFVTVKVSGKGFDEDMYDPVAIEGTLHVGVTVESGYVTGLYTMDGQKMIKPGH